MTRQHYPGPLVDVSDDRVLCQHSGECVRGMPAVFDPKARLWINPQQADTPDLADQLREVVGRCPSGALGIVEHVVDSEASR